MQISPPARRLSHLFALLAVLCLTIPTLPAQFQSQQSVGGLSNEPDAPEPVYTTTHLDGVVVSSLDGKPVPRVLVTSPDRRMAAITDSGGRFSFDLRRAVPQTSTQTFSSFPFTPAAAPTLMSIRFHVSRPGYIGNDIALRVAAIQPDTPEPLLQLKIVPSATLTGHLDPDAGDLPTDASVMLARKNVYNGTATWGFFNARVNSHGEFRFANLPPGDFKLFAPAYDPQFQLHQPLPDSIPGFRAAYYPNAANFDSAAIIHLGPGESARADLSYRSTNFYNVTVPITGLPDGKGFFVTMLGDVPGFPSASLNHSGDIAQGYLPNGDFNLQFTSEENSTRENQFPIASVASVHLQIDGKPVRTQPVAFHPAFEVPIEVRLEFTNGPPPQADPQHPNPFAMVNLEPIGTVGLRAIARMTPGPSVARNLSEGTFRVSADSYVGGYVASFTSGTTDLLREPLRVLPGVPPRPIEITIRDDSASINARLAPSANLLPQATNDQPVFILGIPLDRPQAQAINFAVQLDNFSMDNLAPGRYLILASHHQMTMSMQPTQGIEYRDEDVVRDLMSKGATITLSPGQKTDLEIPLMPEDSN